MAGKRINLNRQPSQLIYSYTIGNLLDYGVVELTNWMVWMESF